MAWRPRHSYWRWLDLQRLPVLWQHEAWGRRWGRASRLHLGSHPPRPTLLPGSLGSSPALLFHTNFYRYISQQMNYSFQHQKKTSINLKIINEYAHDPIYTDLPRWVDCLVWCILEGGMWQRWQVAADAQIYWLALVHGCLYRPAQKFMSIVQILYHNWHSTHRSLTQISLHIWLCSSLSSMLSIWIKGGN